MLKVDYITNSKFNSRTYILSDEGSGKVWLVDCGDVFGNDGSLRQALDKLSSPTNEDDSPSATMTITKRG